MLFTAQELKKRQGEPNFLIVKRNEAPAKQTPSTSTAELVRNNPEKEPTLPVPTDAPSPSTSIATTVRDRGAANVPSVQLNIPVPTDTIIAFGEYGKNEIWRTAENEWTKWAKGKDCGWGYACVRAHSTIYIIGGCRGLNNSPETDIYDISREEWSKGPRLNVPRLDAYIKQLPNSFLLFLGTLKVSK